MRLPPLPRERRLRDDINAPTPLDTLTTRFLMLFVIVLAIPLLSIIIFTVNLLSSQVDQTTLREALRNDGALQRAFQTAFQSPNPLSLRRLPRSLPAPIGVPSSLIWPNAAHQA